MAELSFPKRSETVIKDSEKQNWPIANLRASPLRIPETNTCGTHFGFSLVSKVANFMDKMC